MAGGGTPSPLWDRKHREAQAQAELDHWLLCFGLQLYRFAVVGWSVHLWPGGSTGLGGVREGAPSSVLAHLCYTLPVTATIIVHWAWVFGIYPILCQVTPEIIALTLWYSVAAVGIAIVNDFKSVEGDDLIRKLHSTGLP